MTNTTKPGGTRWQHLVAEGIKRDGNRNWFLGDAALEIAPMGPVGPPNGTGALLDQYADEVGVGRPTLDLCRQVAHTWPVGNRLPTTSWKVHQMLMAKDHQPLIRKGMTVTEAHRALGHSTAGRTGPQAPVEQRVQQAQQLLTDPEVAQVAVEFVASDPARTAQAINRAEHLRPAPAKPERPVSPLGYVAALGVGARAVLHARNLAPDVSTLVAALRNEAIPRADIDVTAFQEDAAALRQAAETLRMYADELDIAREGGVSDDRLNALLDDAGDQR